MFLSIAFWLYALATLATLLIGLLYAFRTQVMPYHLEALETEWDDIKPNYQILLKALLNGGGFFGISTSLFMLTLLVGPFKSGELWAGYAIGLISLIGILPLGLIVHKVKTQTPGNPPFGVMVVIIAITASGLIATLIAGVS